MSLFPNGSMPPCRPGAYAEAVQAWEDEQLAGCPAAVEDPLGDVLGELPGRHSLPTAAKPKPTIRSTCKASQWSEATYRAYAYVSDRLRDPGQQADLAALLEQTIQAGPDFLRVRANATFAPVPIVAYSPEAAREIMRQAREIERESYASRAKGAHGGALGRMGLQLLEWFAFILWPKSGRFGMVPSLAHIATASRMSRDTVVEAMKRLERFGFLTVQRRRRRVPTPLGVKVVQATNAYVLGLAKGLGALALAAFANKPPPLRGNGRPESTKTRAIKSEHYSSAGLWITRDRTPDSVRMRT